MYTEFENTEIAFRYRSDSDLKRARFLFSFIASPALTKMGIALTKMSIAMHLPVKWLLRNTIFAQFCGGESLQETTKTTNIISHYNVDTILDYGVEGKESEQEFDKAVPEFIKAINYAASQMNIPFISLKITGFARFALLEKISAGEQLTDQESAEWKRVYARIDEICLAAYKCHIMVLIDAEETWIIEACNQLIVAMMEKYNKKAVTVFNTFQMYCTGTLEFLKYSYDEAVKHGYILGAKLVRGAYMEKERRRANEMGYPDPIQPYKANTDKDYDEGVLFCLERIDKTAVFIGTHNEQSCAKAVKYIEDHEIRHYNEHIFFSQLYGMSDNISFNLAHNGYRVSKYLPYGPVKDVVPYLLRRAQENTSVAGQTSRELSLINKEIKRRGL